VRAQEIGHFAHFALQIAEAARHKVFVFGLAQVMTQKRRSACACACACACAGACDRRRAGRRAVRVSGRRAGAGGSALQSSNTAKAGEEGGGEEQERGQLT
jgi:hypothetical protein